MILLLAGAALGVLAIRAGLRRRRAERAMAARFVSRAPTSFTPRDVRFTELLAAERDRRAAFDTAAEQYRIARSRYFHQLHNPELYE